MGKWEAFVGAMGLVLGGMGTELIRFFRGKGADSAKMREELWLQLASYRKELDGSRERYFKLQETVIQLQKKISEMSAELSQMRKHGVCLASSDQECEFRQKA